MMAVCSCTPAVALLPGPALPSPRPQGPCLPTCICDVFLLRWPLLRQSDFTVGVVNSTVLSKSCDGIDATGGYISLLSCCALACPVPVPLHRFGDLGKDELINKRPKKAKK